MPLLYELTPANITSPLSQFMGKTADEEGMRDIVRTINAGLSRPRPERALDMAYDALWSQLKTELDAVSAPEGLPKPERPERELLEEALGILRGLRIRVDAEGSAAAKYNLRTSAVGIAPAEPVLSDVSQEPWVYMLRKAMKRLAGSFDVKGGHHINIPVRNHDQLTQDEQQLFELIEKTVRPRRSPELVRLPDPHAQTRRTHGLAAGR